MKENWIVNGRQRGEWNIEQWNKTRESGNDEQEMKVEQLIKVEQWMNIGDWMKVGQWIKRWTVNES